MDAQILTTLYISISIKNGLAFHTQDTSYKSQLLTAADLKAGFKAGWTMLHSRHIDSPLQTSQGKARLRWTQGSGWRCDSRTMMFITALRAASSALSKAAAKVAS